MGNLKQTHSYFLHPGGARVHQEQTQVRRNRDHKIPVLFSWVFSQALRILFPQLHSQILFWHRRSLSHDDWIGHQRMRVLVGVTTAVKKPMTGSRMERKGFIWLKLPHCSSPLKEVRSENKQDRNLEAGADAEAMEDCCLLPCFPWLAQPAFL